MNFLLFLPMYLPFLDVAFGPSFSSGDLDTALDPATKAILIVVLVLFLAFIGYLIWKSIRDKKNDK